MIACESGYYNATFTICQSDGTCFTQSGPMYVTVTSDADISEQLKAADAKLNELADELYDKAKECAERCDVDRPALRPNRKLRLKGRHRARPVRLNSTFG